jgi:hypothetical protein
VERWHRIGFVSLWLLACVFGLFTLLAPSRFYGFDSHAYWLAWQHADMYGLKPNQQDAYLYSPAFAQLIWPLAQLPWPAFFAIWTAAGFAAYAWLVWPLELRWRIPLLVICVPQAIVGNVWPAFALVLVFGFLRPGLWTFPLLTKVTAATGFVWFAARREWRHLTTAAVTAALVTAVSVAISPGLWLDWLHLLEGGGSAGRPAGAVEIPLSVRLPVALVLAIVAARKGRVWLLALSMALASPTFALSWLLSNLMVLTALPRSREQGAQTPAAETATRTSRLRIPRRSRPAPRTVESGA